MRYTETHYVQNGEMTSQVDAVRSTIRVLNNNYGLTPAKDFGPLALKAVRHPKPTCLSPNGQRTTGLWNCSSRIITANAIGTKQIYSSRRLTQ